MHLLNHFLTNLIKQLFTLSNIIQVTLLFPGHWSHMALVWLQENTVKTGSYLNSYSRLKDFSSARLTAVEWVDWMKSWQSCWWLLSLEVKSIYWNNTDDTCRARSFLFPKFKQSFHFGGHISTTWNCLSLAQEKVYCTEQKILRSTKQMSLSFFKYRSMVSNSNLSVFYFFSPWLQFLCVLMVVVLVCVNTYNTFQSLTTSVSQHH